jgi:hypothetical protein
MSVLKLFQPRMVNRSAKSGETRQAFQPLIAQKL